MPEQRLFSLVLVFFLDLPLLPSVYFSRISWIPLHRCGKSRSLTNSFHNMVIRRVHTLENTRERTNDSAELFPVGHELGEGACSLDNTGSFSPNTKSIPLNSESFDLRVVQRFCSDIVYWRRGCQVSDCPSQSGLKQGSRCTRELLIVTCWPPSCKSRFTAGMRRASGITPSGARFKSSVT